MTITDRLKSAWNSLRGVEVDLAILEAIRRGGNGYERDESLKCTALLSGVRLLSETAAMVPLKVYERRPEGRVVADQHELYPLLHDAPSPEWTSFEWRERMMLDCIINGNHYSQLILNGRDEVKEILPLNPWQMQIERVNGELVYKYTTTKGLPREFPSREILHIPLMRRYDDVPKGRSLVEIANQAIGIAMNAEQFAAKFFENDATPRLVLRTTNMLSPEKQKELQEVHNKTFRGSANAHGMMVISGGQTELDVIQHDVDKLQLNPTRLYQVQEVARVLRIPPNLLYDLSRATFNNAEHDMMGYQVYSASPWFARIAARINMQLFGPRESSQYYAEFEPDSLVRADYQSRTEGMAREIASGLMMPDEGRRMLNRPSAPGGDKLYIQGAMVPLTEAGQKPDKVTQNV